MDKVRLGIIGLGNMGRVHAASLLAGNIAGCELAAVCDGVAARLEPYPQLAGFTDPHAFLASGKMDAVLIATPHYSHTTLGIAALEAGLHVLVEKPLSVHKADCERLIAAHRDPAQVFAAMFNQRTDPKYRKLRELVQSGELGEIRRINWIITDWFRPGAYYGSGGWRATWAGEGGGVLLNQCPHNLDLLQWIFGMPVAVQAFCSLGRYHEIEVEDDVTAYLEFPNGATGVFITSTGEAPGTNRLEVTAERGRVVLENGTFSYLRNVVEMSEFSRTTRQPFSAPEKWEINIPLAGLGGQHNEILANFAAAILRGEPLIAPAAEGIYSVELANAMISSSLQQKKLTLPLDAADYAARLHDLVVNSSFVKPPEEEIEAADFAKSVGR